MLDLNNNEIKFALEAVNQASLLVKRIQTLLVSPALTKDDRSPVTVADFASQALVGQMLSKAFPKDLMVAEEDSSALRAPGAEGTLEQVTAFARQVIPQASPAAVCQWIDHGRVDSAARFWTLDPIDGTKGFLRGDQYAVALALVVDGVVQIGVLGCPNLENASQPNMDGAGSLVIAVRGQGTWTSPITGSSAFRKLSVSAETQTSQARILRSFESGHTNVSQIDIFAQELGVQADPVRMDSQAKYAVLADGKGELLLRLLSPSKPDYREKIWDQAAGSLVLQEAGGRITDLHGRDLDFSTGRSLVHNRGILATNNRLHAAALHALANIGA